MQEIVVLGLCGSFLHLFLHAPQTMSHFFDKSFFPHLLYGSILHLNAAHKQLYLHILDIVFAYRSLN